MTDFRKHEVLFIEKWGKNRKGFVASLPDAKHTVFADGETLLGEDVAVSNDPIAKTVQMKTFSKSETVASLARVEAIEARLKEFLTSKAYAEAEVAQNQNILKLIQTLDLKELDIADFLNAIASLATQEQIINLTDRLDASEKTIQEQNALIAALNAELLDRVAVENNQVLQLGHDNDTYFTTILTPPNHKIESVRIFAGGMKMPHTAYRVAGDNIIFNVDMNILRVTEVDAELSFKKIVNQLGAKQFIALPDKTSFETPEFKDRKSVMVTLEGETIEVFNNASEHVFKNGSHAFFDGNLTFFNKTETDATFFVA
jgi:hypothetical protein